MDQDRRQEPQKWVALSWWTGWFLITQITNLGAHFNTGDDTSQRQSASPDALCWTGRIPCRRESSRTVSSFHSTHHWGLPNCTPQKQRLHCTEEARILLFLLLQGQYFCSSLEMMVGSREDFFQHKWLLSPGSSDLNCTGSFQSQQFSFHCPLLAQCCPGVTPDQSHHHLLQKKILNTGGGVKKKKKKYLSTHSYSEDEITRQLIRMSKWS